MGTGQGWAPAGAGDGGGGGMMADRTQIEWTDATWNPVTGCSRVSPGCAHCYAERLERRFRPDWKPWTAAYAAHNVRLHPDRLDQPLRWRKPRRIFVCSMSDLFHEQVPDEFIVDVFHTMGLAHWHVFQVLTKRPERMLRLLTDDEFVERVTYVEGEDESGRSVYSHMPWPLPNVWIGVTAEDQKRANERIPLLLQVPAVVRFVSAEPLLGPIDLRAAAPCPDCDGSGVLAEALDGRLYACETCGGYEDGLGHGIDTGLNWVIVGGESGPGARPMHPDWVRRLRDQCQEAGIPFFFKQWGEWREACPPDDPIWGGNPPELLAAHGTYFARLGKKAAGRVLDGRTWDEMPEV